MGDAKRRRQLNLMPVSQGPTESTIEHHESPTKQTIADLVEKAAQSMRQRNSRGFVICATLNRQIKVTPMERRMRVYQSVVDSIGNRELLRQVSRCNMQTEFVLVFLADEGRSSAVVKLDKIAEVFNA